MVDISNKYMSLAIEEAKSALPVDVPVGAVIVKGDNVIVSSANRRERDHDSTAHAEIIVIREAGKIISNWRLSDCILYVTLEPCPMCAAAILQSRIKTLVFGTYDFRDGACGSASNLFCKQDDIDIYGGVMEASCKALLTEFFETRR